MRWKIKTEFDYISKQITEDDKIIIRSNKQLPNKYTISKSKRTVTATKFKETELKE